MTKNPIFCAIDTTDIDKARRLITSIAPYVGGIKLGLEFFTANGAAGVKHITQLGVPLFLDLKFHDIPNTVAKAYRDLEVMGLLFTRRGKGVFVKPGIESRCREECLNRIAARMHEVMVEARVAGISNELAAEIVAISLASNASPYGPTPPSVLKLIKKATKKS